MEKDVSRIRSALTLGIFLIAAIVLVRAPLTESFWLDETLTVWVISGSLEEAVSRAWEYKQSVLFHALFWFWSQMVGTTEVGMRLPSFFATLVSTYLVFRVAKRLGDATAGYFAAVLFFASETSVLSALSCRPYAFAQLGFLICIDSFLALRHSPSAPRTFAAIAGFFAAVAFHYLFAISYVVLLLFIYATVSPASNRRSSIIVLSSNLIAAVVGLAVVVNWSLHGPVLSFAVIPTVKNLLAEIVQPSVLVYALVPTALGLIYGGLSQFALPYRTTLVLLTWTIAAPCIFFAASLLSGTSLWVPRYWYWQAPGVALLLGLILSATSRSGKWWILTLGLLGMILFREGVRQWNPEPWRELAMAIERDVKAGHECSEGIELISGLIEAQDKEFVAISGHRPYLSAPLLVYGVPAKLIFPRHELSGVKNDERSEVLCLAGVKRFGLRAANKAFDFAEEQLRTKCRYGVSEFDFAMLRLVICLKEKPL